MTVQKVYKSKEFISDTESGTDSDSEENRQSERNSEENPRASTSESITVRIERDAENEENRTLRDDDDELNAMRSEIRRENRLNFTKTDRFYLLKCLYESVAVETGGFNLKSFDWDEFNMRCQEAELGIAITTPADALKKYKTQYFSSQKNIFQHLDPEPTLTDKLTFIYEALVRYSVLNRKWRHKELIILRPSLLFTVVYEHYSAQDATWKPPEKLKKLQELVDSEKIENRVENSKIERKRRKRDTESPRFAIKTKKIERDGSQGRRSVLGVRMELDETAEISSIHESSTIISETEELTHLEISEITENSLLQGSSSADLLVDETILARGGGHAARIAEEKLKSFELNQTILKNVHNPMDSLILPEINVKEAEKRKREEKKPFQIEETDDVWSQLVNC